MMSCVAVWCNMTSCAGIYTGQYDGTSEPLPEYHVKIAGFDEKVCGLYMCICTCVCIRLYTVLYTLYYHSMCCTCIIVYCAIYSILP